MAVGFTRRENDTYGTFVEIWDGNHWRTVRTRDPVASPDTELEDVACPAINRCVAVGWRVSGTDIVTLAATWDGKRWTVRNTPSPSGAVSSSLDGVDCPRWRFCVAVGASSQQSPLGNAFSEIWDGDKWAIVPIAHAR